MKLPAIGLRPAAMGALTIALLLTVPSASPEAAPFDGKPKILLHAQGIAASKVDACSVVTLSDCQDAVTEGDLVSGSSGFYFTYLLVARGSLPGLNGFQFGISYQENLPENLIDGAGIDIFDWTLCAYQYFPQPTPIWPAPLSGALIIWDDDYPCPSGDFAVAGYFYLGAYSADVLEIIPRPVDGAAKVATCIFEEHLLESSDLGSVAFSSGATVPGCNPCDGPCPIGVPVREATWSGVKTLLR